jgi:glycosyl-4,4'-diaponeurosporenoate acyltransferase
MALSKPALVLVDVAAWAVIHSATGYLVHKMPARAFEQDRGIWAERRFEQGGRTWVRLGVLRWKKWLPEAGDLFTGGFNKSKVPSRSNEGLELYARETRRAELGHWLAAGFAPTFLLWNPWYAGVPMLFYAVASNGPCVVSQRYNRIRIKRVLALRSGSPDQRSIRRVNRQAAS